MLLVPDQKERHVWIVRGETFSDDVHPVGIVAEPAPGGVNDHRVRKGIFRSVGVFLSVGSSPAGRHRHSGRGDSYNCRTGGARRPQPVAADGLRGDRAEVVRAETEQFCDGLGIPVETAGCQHDRTDYVAFPVAGLDTHPRYSATLGAEQGNDRRRKIDVDVVLTEHLREEYGHEAGTKGQRVRAIRQLPALRRRDAAESGNAGMVGDDGVFGGSSVVCVGAEVGGSTALDVHVGVRRADWKVWRDEKPVAPFIENRTVDDRAGEIAAFGQSTRRVIVIVGEVGNDFPLYRPDLLPVAHRYRSDSE